MKKFLLTVLAITVVALLAVTMVACDDYDPTMGGGPNDYNRATYTVTFRTTTQLADISVKVKHGDKVSIPKDANGNDIVPFKEGYNFKGWSAKNDVNQLFNFDVDVITANTTLTAKFEAISYEHTPVLTGKLIIDADGNYSVDEEGYPEGKITLGTNEKLRSTYNSNTNYLVKPTIKIETGEPEDEFLFWYYMTDVIDEEGNKVPDGAGNFRQRPVQFTQRVKEGESSSRIVETYKFTNGLKLYPMLKSNLPNITVKFYSQDETVYDTKQVPVGEKLYLDEAPASPTRSDGFTFGRWYYVSISEDEDGEEVRKDVDFRFSEKADEATSKTEVVGTDIMDAAGVNDFFTAGTLELRAKWIQDISIASVSDFETKLYNKLHGAEELSAEELESLLNANIKITADLNFDGKTYEPLFDAARHFVGVIDGGVYEENNVTSKIKISGGTFGNSTHASVFGYVDGKLLNIDFENIGLAISAVESKYVDTAYMAAIATANGGEIRNCDVTFANLAISGLGGVMFGGVSVFNNGKADSNDNGYIVNCSVTFTGSFDVESLVFGGITAEQNSRAVISENCSANVTLTAMCDKILRIGGLVGNNNGTLNRATATIDVTAADCPEEFVFGGICALNTLGTVGRCSANATLCSDAAPAKVKGTLSQLVCVGGLIGRNDGTAINSYAVANLFVAVDTPSQNGSVVSVGGLVGSNYSSLQDKSNSQTSGVGAINYCYSTGQVSVKVADTVDNIVVNVGGIAGRNNQSKLSRIFSDVEIVVVNKAEHAVNRLGYLFGTMEYNNGSSSSVGVNVYYGNDCNMTLNDKLYTRTEKEPPVDAGDDYEPEYEESFPVVTRGEGTEKSNFRSAEFVINSADNSSKMGFDSDIWQMTEGELPTLKV